MANEYEIFEFLEATEDNLSRKRRRTKQRLDLNLFDLDDESFRRRYRLSKELAHSLCDELRPLMPRPKKSSDLPVETKVLIALAFYASGSYQRPIGTNEGHFVAQQTVSSVIAQVTACLNTEEIQRKYIKFPQNQQEQNLIKTEFYNKYGIPGVLGCIGCSHVAILRPGLHEERYSCRKQYHSLNVQLICDANMQIISVDASFGGATHNSLIWANHPIKAQLEELSNTKGSWLLGDSSYPQHRTMMTPIPNAASESPEAHYTSLHGQARNIVERTIGLLKARFRCLLVHKVLHYAPEVAGTIVKACVVLHNICNRANIPTEQLSNEEMVRETQLQVQAESLPHSNNIDLQEGLATRSRLVERLWELRVLKLKELV